VIPDAESAQTRPVERPPVLRSGFLPCAVLVFVAPLVGEVLAGSTPIDMLGSPTSFLAVFLLEALLYGGGAVLVRELARRTGRGLPTILGLGLAYGVLEEGLITPSFFNPDFLGSTCSSSAASSAWAGCGSPTWSLCMRSGASQSRSP